MATASIAPPLWLTTFAQRLEEIRGHAGLTQEALARPELSKSFMSLLETARSYPSIDTLLLLSRRLRTSLAALLLDADERRLDIALALLSVAIESVNDRPHLAVRLVRTIEELFPEMPSWLRSEVLTVLGNVAFKENRLAEADRFAVDALRAAESAAFAPGAARVLFLRGRIALHRRDFSSAFALLSEAVRRLRTSRALRSKPGIDALIHLGSAAVMVGRPRLARRRYADALAMAKRLRLVAFEGKATMNLALLAWRKGDLRDAVALMEQAIGALEHEQQMQDLATSVANLGTLHRELGELDAAHKAFERGIRLKTQLGDVRGRSATYEELARLLLQRNDLKGARATARLALKDATVLDDAYLRGHALATLGRIALARRRRKEAMRYLRQALRLFKGLRLRDDLSEVQRDLQIAQGELWHDAEVAAYLDQALRKQVRQLPLPQPRARSTKPSRLPRSARTR